MLEHHGMTRGEAMRRSKPGEAKPLSGHTRPTDQEGAGEDSNGDGGHSHTITKHDDGRVSSLHTHPDGTKEPMDHADYAEAKDHMDSMMGEDGGESGEPDGDEPMPSDGSDMAGMYASHCK